MHQKKKNHSLEYHVEASIYFLYNLNGKRKGKKMDSV